MDSEVALEQTDWHTDTAAAAQTGTHIITRLQSFIVQFEAATTICTTVLACMRQQQQDMHALRQRVQQLLHELALQRREMNIYKMREKVLLSRSSRLRDSLSSLGAQGEKGSDREQTLASQLGLQLKDLQVLNAGLEEEMATAQAETGLKEQMLVDMRKALDKKEALQQELLADLSHAASELVRTRLELGIAQEHSG
jgi:chromosome segregation ATPase